MPLEYEPKDVLDSTAQEVLDFLRPKELPIWQVKEVLMRASRLAEYEKLK